MYIEVITTITSRIELGDESGFKSLKHSVDIDGGEFGEALGQRATLMVVKGACEAAKVATEEALDGSLRVFKDEV